jgi:hypothetical protein
MPLFPVVPLGGKTYSSEDIERSLVDDPWRQLRHFDHFGADTNTRRSWRFLFLVTAFVPRPRLGYLY